MNHIKMEDSRGQGRVRMCVSGSVSMVNVYVCVHLHGPVSFCEAGPPLVQQKQEEDKEEKEERKGERGEE